MNFIINTAWLIVEKLFFLIGGFIVSVVVAKHIGPEGMGVISYALTIAAVLIAISEFGSHHIIFNRTIKRKESARKLIIYTRRFRTVVYLFLCCLFCCFYYIKNGVTDNFIVIITVITGSLYTAIEVYKYYFNGCLRSKVNAISAQIALIVALVVRYVFVEVDLPFVFFGIPFVIQPLICFFIRKREFQIEVKQNKKNKTVEKKYIKYISITGSFLIITNVSVIAYTKIGNIFLLEIVNEASLGVLSVGVTLSNIWTFVPLALMTSISTLAFKEKVNKELISGLGFINFLGVFISIPFIFIVYEYSESIVYKTYGEDFIQVSKILTILSVSALFSILGIINARFISYKSGYKYLLYKTLLLAIVSIPLSYFLITSYGIVGAATSILIMEILSCTIFNYFFERNIILKSHLRIFTSLGYAKKF
ncbi:oligosaccharide flippase family protein [Vibrio splendidus]|nr:oligosaccharide flippase family protein [Vibrio splendidus]